MKTDSLVMSNLDHRIPSEMESFLRANPDETGEHTAWDHWGKVWFKDELFHEEVWVYGSPRETLSAPTLHELMELVNSRWGYA